MDIRIFFVYLCITKTECMKKFTVVAETKSLKRTYVQVECKDVLQAVHNAHIMVKYKKYTGSFIILDESGFKVSSYSNLK